MPYNPALVAPMREEMVRLGVMEPTTVWTWTPRWATRRAPCWSS